MSSLYPLKFRPTYQERIWGGSRMHALLNKAVCENGGCGESWELSGVEGHISEVSNGFLEGNDLQELIEIYMGDLVGDRVYEQFGTEFPLLIKFIDAMDDLSIQVHPGDDLSKKRHNAYGKTEMWYVLHADEGSMLNSGFNQPVDREKYLEYLNSGRLTELLHFEEVKDGDVFFIPAGRVHAIGKGLIIAEIQQTSDVTYRIYDYDRKDKNGNLRELHTDLALDAIDFSYKENYKTHYKPVKNKTAEIVTCDYFCTNIVLFDQPVIKEIAHIDSFVIYICIDGSYEIVWDGGREQVKKGETVLIPASLTEYRLEPTTGETKVLEVHLP
ncbi:mannose-6-phosphate isomerase, type 1 [Bacteroidales bacterium 6E]|nr:mannose-6-phosphate isomerase, type 1 [Bacteroidales bacterium 6E]